MDKYQDYRRSINSDINPDEIVISQVKTEVIPASKTYKPSSRRNGQLTPRDSYYDDKTTRIVQYTVDAKDSTALDRIKRLSTSSKKNLSFAEKLKLQSKNLTEEEKQSLMPETEPIVPENRVTVSSTKIVRIDSLMDSIREREKERERKRELQKKEQKNSKNENLPKKPSIRKPETVRTYTRTNKKNDYVKKQPAYEQPFYKKPNKNIEQKPKIEINKKTITVTKVVDDKPKVISTKEVIPKKKLDNYEEPITFASTYKRKIKEPQQIQTPQPQDGKKNIDIKEDIKPKSNIIIETTKIEIKKETEPIVVKKIEIKKESEPVVVKEIEIKKEPEPVVVKEIEIKKEPEPVVQTKIEIKKEPEPVVQTKIEIKKEPVENINKEEVQPRNEIKKEPSRNVKKIVKEVKEVRFVKEYKKPKNIETNEEDLLKNKLNTRNAKKKK